MIGPEHEAPRPADGAAFSDAVTFAFGDAAADVYGVARVGFSDERTASGLGIVFSGGEPVAVQADGGAEAEAREWAAIDAAGLGTTVETPLEAWTVSFASDDATFDLRFTAAGAPAQVDAGGMEGYEQLCRVEGDAVVGGRRVTLDCLGQRGHSWGAPDWSRMTLARTLGVWVEGPLGVSLLAIRPEGEAEHDGEVLVSHLHEHGEPVVIMDPRLSTIYDAEGRQRRAGLELWLDEESPALRAAGQVVCGTSLDLGRLRLDCAFFNWRMDGRSGVGRYDVLRRVDQPS